MAIPGHKGLWKSDITNLISIGVPLIIKKERLDIGPTTHQCLPSPTARI